MQALQICNWNHPRTIALTMVAMAMHGRHYHDHHDHHDHDDHDDHHDDNHICARALILGCWRHGGLYGQPRASASTLLPRFASSPSPSSPSPSTSSLPSLKSAIDVVALFFRGDFRGVFSPPSVCYKHEKGQQGVVIAWIGICGHELFPLFVLQTFLGEPIRTPLKAWVFQCLSE